MKAVAVLAVVALIAVGAFGSEFNTHDADALEVDEAADAEVEDYNTQEAQLVDADEMAAADSVEFEDEMDDSAEDAAEEEGEMADMDAAADALDTDEADAAVEQAEADAEQAGEHNVENAFKSLTKADLSSKAKACKPDAVKCPDGKAPFDGWAGREPDYNGCGPAGSFILSDATLGGRFSPCCNNHDLCYGRKFANKDACDTSFLNCMKDVCKGATFCDAQASLYHTAVSSFGCPAWKASRLRKGCHTGKEAETNPVTNSTKVQTTVAATEAASKFFAGKGTTGF